MQKPGAERKTCNFLLQKAKIGKEVGAGQKKSIIVILRVLEMPSIFPQVMNNLKAFKQSGERLSECVLWKGHSGFSDG